MYALRLPEGFKQKLTPAFAARVVSGLFYLGSAFLVVLVTKALFNEGNPTEADRAARLFIGIFLSGTIMHSAILFLLAGRFSVRQFIGIAAAWIAPLLLLLSWRML